MTRGRGESLSNSIGSSIPSIMKFLNGKSQKKQTKEPQQDWRQVIRNAIETELDFHGDSVAMRGSFPSAGDSETFWYITRSEIVTVQAYESGRNEKMLIKLQNVIDMHLTHSQHVRSSTPVVAGQHAAVMAACDNSSVSGSSVISAGTATTYRQYAQNMRMNISSNSLNELYKTKTLCILFKDALRKNVNILMIPLHQRINGRSAASGKQSSLDKVFLQMKSYWVESQIGADVFGNDQYNVLWRGISEFTETTMVLAWAITATEIVFCHNDNNQTTKIPFSRICDIDYHCQGHETGGSISVHYVAKNDSAQHDILYDVAGEIVENVLHLPEFGTREDFNELGLLWRQSLQLQLISVAFSGSQTDKIISDYILTRADASEFDQANDTTECQNSDSLNSIKADSMRRIFVKNLPASPVENVNEDQSQKLMERKANLLEHPPSPPPQQQQLDAPSFTMLPVAEFDIRRNTSAQAQNRLTSLDAKASTYKNEKVNNLFVALYNYSAVENGELKLKENDLIRVIRRDESGWWYGLKLKQLQGHDGDLVVVSEGWCPSNFLKSYV